MKNRMVTPERRRSIWPSSGYTDLALASYMPHSLVVHFQVDMHACSYVNFSTLISEYFDQWLSTHYISKCTC